MKLMLPLAVLTLMVLTASAEQDITRKELTIKMLQWRNNVTLYRELNPFARPVDCYGVNDDCCTEETPCDLGQGDCDDDEECGIGLRCGNRNCLNRKFGDKKRRRSLGFADSDDCCEDRGWCDGGNSCCSSDRPCVLDEGDCDWDSHCAFHLVCGSNNCDKNLGRFEDGDDCCTFSCDDLRDIPEELKRGVKCY